MIKAIAPGKLILSGEHAVVHGQPALAMAVNRYSEATIVPQAGGQVLFDASNLQYQDSLTWQALRKLKRRLQRNYENFLQGSYSIRDVLKKPIELSQYAITHVLETLNYHAQPGFRVKTQSTIPMGCGMGSSAATLMSVLHAFGLFLQLDWDDQHYLKEALQIEHLQHGHSSGLDLTVSQQGGCVFFDNGQTNLRSVPTWPLYMVNTGQPLSTTGECVSAAKQHVTNDLLKDFGDTTRALDSALQNDQFVLAQDAVRENHQLLIQLRVVPEKVREFITVLERFGAAAKVCGAGAIIGHKAGIVLIFSQSDPTAVCEQYGYSCMQIQGSRNGIQYL